MLERWSKESRENKQSMCVSFVFELDKIRKKSAECFVLIYEGVFRLDESTYNVVDLKSWKQKNHPRRSGFDSLSFRRLERLKLW